MSEDVLLQSLENNVLTLTLNRPEKLNAFNPRLMAAFLDAIQAAAKNKQARVVIITGAGRGFCAGGDLGGKPKAAKPEAEETLPKEKRAPDLAANIDWLRTHMDASRILYEMPKPTIAMIRGATVSVGMAIAAACDFRMVSDTSVFTTGFAKAGLSGDYGVSYFLTQLLGTAKTRELMFLCEKFNAEEAKRIGFASHVVADAELDAFTEQFAAKLAAGPAVIQRYIKRNLNFAQTASLSESLDLEATLNVLSAQSNDHKEAVKAFIERRDPIFSGD